MTRLTAKDFPQQLLEYYDYYAHGKISKREFLQLAGKYTVGGMTALALFQITNAATVEATFAVQLRSPESIERVTQLLTSMVLTWLTTPESDPST